jgi:hypothetical protein
MFCICVYKCVHWKNVGRGLGQSCICVCKKSIKVKKYVYVQKNYKKLINKVVNHVCLWVKNHVSMYAQKKKSKHLRGDTK